MRLQISRNRNELSCILFNKKKKYNSKTILCHNKLMVKSCMKWAKWNTCTSINLRCHKYCKANTGPGSLQKVWLPPSRAAALTPDSKETCTLQGAQLEVLLSRTTESSWTDFPTWCSNLFVQLVENVACLGGFKRLWFYRRLSELIL